MQHQRRRRRVQKLGVIDAKDQAFPRCPSTERFCAQLEDVQPILAALPPDTFDVVVTGDAVSQGKPHPEPYLKAAALLGIDPAHALAIEDSNTGARSAEAAGCTVLVVPNHVPVLEGDRRVFAETLVGLRAGELPVPVGGRS